MSTSTPASQNSKPALGLEAIYAPISTDLDRNQGLFEKVLNTDNQFVLDMVRYLAQSKGKQVRSALTMLTYRACMGERFEEGSRAHEQALVTAEAVELIHTATLIHDDVIDDSPVRRGKKTLNYRWGNEITVLMGDFVFARVFGLLARRVKPEVIQVLSLATDRLCEGEIQEVRNRWLVNMTEAEYTDTIEKKTAALMAVACEAAAMLAGVDEATRVAARDYGMKIGTAFQVADDLLDLEASEEKLGKPQGHDIKEGKLTLPLIVALRQAGADKRPKIQDLVLKEDLAETEMSQVVQFIKDEGGLEYTRERADRLVNEAKKDLQSIPDGACRQSLAALADYIIRRDY